MSLPNQNGQNSLFAKSQASIQGIGHSVGLKLLLVCFLVLLMGIPTLFIAAISFERAGRADDVTLEVSQRYGGAQTLLGPVLSVPYTITYSNGEPRTTGDFVVFAEEGAAHVENLQTTVRKRSLFKVPTYHTNVKFTAKFKIPDRDNLGTSQHTFYWDEAKISIGLTEVRGLRDDVYLQVGGKQARKFGPGGSTLGTIQSTNVNVHNGSHSFKSYGEYIPLQFMSVSVGDLLAGKNVLNISATLPISGSQQLSISPFAQTTKANITADWPHPGFLGKYPPMEREITDTGFSASWTVPFLARGMAAMGEARGLNLGQLSDKAMSVKFVNPVNPYQNVNRALKYAVLFIGMVFLAYFLFETLVGVKVHAAQYVLVGLAQCVFYLLLLAFAEHFGFTLAFMFASGATVFITAAYAGVVFGKPYRFKAGAVFMATYGMLYVLMRIEDFALMVGALISFLAITTTMYLTRNINWYGNSKEADVATSLQT